MLTWAINACFLDSERSGHPLHRWFCPYIFMPSPSLPSTAKINSHAKHCYQFSKTKHFATDRGSEFFTAQV